ncbi:MAG: transposase [Kofleriaceae bacterium]
MKSGRGGARPGAGRKRNERGQDIAHAPRPALSSRHPIHVVLRVVKWMPRLREGQTYRQIRRVLLRYLGRDDFRVVHVSIQHNHLHLLVEAADQYALSRAMQSFAINAARAIRRSMRSHGKVFAYRYHATQIRTPYHARHALAYVLNNWRRHREDCASVHALAAKPDEHAPRVNQRPRHDHDRSRRTRDDAVTSVDGRTGCPPRYLPGGTRLRQT